jgi:dolichol-phosphate mannosyltransferase
VKRLSIVIPAYNEERFIGTLLERIRSVDLSSLGLEKDIIVVDDC